MYIRNDWAEKSQVCLFRYGYLKLHRNLHYKKNRGHFTDTSHGALEKTKSWSHCQMVYWISINWNVDRLNALKVKRICLMGRTNQSHCSGYQPINSRSYFWKIHMALNQVFYLLFYLKKSIHIIHIQLDDSIIYYYRKRRWATDLHKNRQHVLQLTSIWSIFAPFSTVEFNSDRLQKRCSNQHSDHGRNNGHTIVGATGARKFFFGVKNWKVEISSVPIPNFQLDETQSSPSLPVEENGPFSMLGIALENLEPRFSGGNFLAC